jgi:hypothetical protein
LIESKRAPRKHQRALPTKGITAMFTRKAAVAAVGVLGLLGLSACATSEKVQAKQIGDSEMTCEQLLAESRRLDEAKREVDSKRGVTGTNVAATLFWLPGLAYTYYDAGQADQLILDRKAWLAQLYDEKGCTKQV